MKTTTRAAALLFALLLMLPLALGCSNGTDPADTTASAATADPGTAEVTEAETDTYSQKDAVPSDINYDDEDVTILYWKSIENEWNSDGICGDIVLDALFTKNSAVQERLGVNLIWHEVPGNGGNTESYCNEVRKSVDTGDATYSLISAYSRNALSCAVMGLLQNIRDYEQVDLNRAWYCKSAVDAATVGNRTFCVAGAISHSYLSRMAGCFFNNDLLANYNLEDPYTLVMDNQWTLEKFLTMQDGLWIDLDNDGTKSAGDQYGIHTDPPQMDCLQYSGGCVFCDYDSDHIPKFSDDIKSDKIVSLVDMWIRIMENGYVSETDNTACFSSGRAAFYLYPLAHVSSAEMRDAAFSFGFVPQPKYNADQENYIVSLTNYFSYWGIPTAVPDGDMSAYLMEVLSSEGYHTVVPAIFEVAYKYRYTSDTTSRQAQIFDIMRENVHVDFGKVCTLSMNNIPATMFRDVIISGYNNYMTKYKLNEKSLNKGLESAIEGLLG